MIVRNLDLYNSAEVVSYYAKDDIITPCEQYLFEKYVPRDASILDLGVGGGRTTPSLSRKAFRYVGVDYAHEMIRACEHKFPLLEFRNMDASDLSCFPAMSFDIVVMSFNGIDSLDTERRQCCFRECYRVLKAEGIFIFSSHNPRAVLVRATWSNERIRRLVDSWSLQWKPLTLCATAVLTCVASTRALFRAIIQSLARIAQRLGTKTFWHGEGYLVDPTHGGLINHYSIPRYVIDEVERFGFRTEEIKAGEFPTPGRIYFTKWYYYVFSKSDLLQV